MNYTDIANALVGTISPDARVRKEGEAFLRRCSGESGYPTALLFLAAPSVAPTPPPMDVPDVVKAAAAVSFKNVIRSRWEHDDVSPDDRSNILSVLPRAALATQNAIVGKQLQAALSLVAVVDFPLKWPELLDFLMETLMSCGSDEAAACGVLRLLHSVTKQFRVGSETDPVYAERVSHIINKFGQCHLQVYTALAEAFAASPSPSPTLVRSLGYCVKIFLSLNSVTIPEFFEDNLAGYMGSFVRFLTVRNPAAALVEHASDSDKPGVLLKLQALVCDCGALYMANYEEEFAPLVEQYMGEVWSMLAAMSGAGERADRVIIAATTFLSRVASSVAHELFASPGSLASVCSQVVIPSVRWPESEVELFEDAPLDYVRRDIEGSDAETKRRAAVELVKRLRKYYEAETTAALLPEIEAMLSSNDWLAKDAAMCLVSALAVSASSASGGVRVVNPGVPIDGFFSSFVLPQLQKPAPSSDVGAQMLLADCLKFACTFRQSLPADALLPLFAQHLASSDSHVVQVYAANAIEKYLLLGGAATAAVNSQLYQTILGGCLRVLLQGETREQQEDLYAMRCLLRLVLATPDKSIVTANAEQLVSGLLTKLSAVAANPSNPGFTHFLFECLAATVSALTTANKESAAALEAGLFPHFQSILSNDVDELVPYTFQVLAMLLECNESVSPAYASLLGPLLTPDLWSRDYNVPALVRLVGAYCRTDPGLMAPHVESMLGIFAQLIKSKKTDHEGFLLLEAMASHMAWTSFEGYLTQLFSLIFARLTAAKTAKFVKSFVIFLALLLGKHEADTVVQKIDSMQDGMFGMVLKSCWLPNVNKVRGRIERKMLAVGSIRLLTQCPSILSKYGDNWLALLNALVTLFELPAAKEDEADAAADAAAEAFLARLSEDNDGTSYTPTFNKLRCAVAASVDPFADVDGNTLPLQLAKQLASFGSAGQVGPALRQLPAEVQQALSRYFQQAGVSMPQ
eukprot:CAMPEP_0170746360 /NCGR_PEP_ID=MMETSP0437-20130122/8767_1 /TAXON_ID=0 /ORGANISM="Sexangularia sp." /LENGTH=974 /DNA_ID=CAMNT_0011085105 /DNA_START=96 /DNA_END=3020 /DNA_ORIENTATION=-